MLSGFNQLLSTVLICNLFKISLKCSILCSKGASLPTIFVIKNPNDPDGDFPIKISISNTSCVTSGVYERYYTVNGTRYHHIIDSETLFPAEYFASLTILTSDSGLADSLSTALFCCDEHTGREILSKIDGVEAIWIYSDGKISYTENVEKLTVD